jgi:hypothetical protein
VSGINVERTDVQPTTENTKLTRMNRGRAATTSFLKSLSEALGEPVEANALVPLAESDALLEVFRNGYQATIDGKLSGHRAFFRAPEGSGVFQLAGCLADQMLGERVFLLAKLSTNCGAVTVDISILLRHTASIVRFDGDSLSAMSIDQTQGVLIDHNPDDAEQTYEVAVWGDRWSSFARVCDRKDLA